MNDIVTRAKVRLSDESVTDEVLNEYAITATDRVNLRLGVDELPKSFNSIVVDVIVKMHHRASYEGISSESADTLSTSFVDDLLNEYNMEFKAYKDRMRNEDNTGSLAVVTFL